MKYRQKKKNRFLLNSFFFIGALSYAEFAARIPRAGSSYIFIYESIGEILAFLVVNLFNLTI
jgi:amino acid transporter